jgi:hypothetical protein
MIVVLSFAHCRAAYSDGNIVAGRMISVDDSDRNACIFFDWYHKTLGIDNSVTLTLLLLTSCIYILSMVRRPQSAHMQYIDIIS